MVTKPDFASRRYTTSLSAPKGKKSSGPRVRPQTRKLNVSTITYSVSNQSFSELEDETEVYCSERVEANGVTKVMYKVSTCSPKILSTYLLYVQLFWPDSTGKKDSIFAAKRPFEPTSHDFARLDEGEEMEFLKQELLRTNVARDITENFVAAAKENQIPIYRKFFIDL